MSKFGEYFRYYWKAVIGFIAPGAISIGAAVLPGSDGGSSITSGELIIAAVAAITTAAGVAAKSNGPNPNAPDPAPTVVNNYTNLTPEETVTHRAPGSELYRKPHILYRGTDPEFIEDGPQTSEDRPPRTE